MVKYQLPRLPYEYDQLEPFIDRHTMQIHHLKHHQEYVDGLNETLEKIFATAHPQYITSILSDLETIPESARKNVNFFGGGYENHKLFWETLTPDGKLKPQGRLGDAIDVYFNNFENFKLEFSKLALSLQGSGWIWLVFNQTYNRVEIIPTQNQDNPWTIRKIPLLCLDLWEHAYYLKYQNNRSKYVENWWDLINWEYVEDKFDELPD